MLFFSYTALALQQHVAFGFIRKFAFSRELWKQIACRLSFSRVELIPIDGYPIILPTCESLFVADLASMEYPDLADI